MKGKFIVIDGLDGTGKGTQTALLIERIKKEGYSIETKDFPQYGTKSAGPVEEYLNGKYGSSKEVGPYRGSILFAVDRYDASFEIRQWLEEGKNVVCNRYVSANLGHQGGKIEDETKRQEYFDWITNLEYNLFEIPKPDINIFLHLAPEIAQTLVDQKGHRDYVGGAKRDIHEADLDHLRDTEKVFLQLAEIMPNASLIKCAPEGELLTREVIHEMIWEIVKKQL